MHIRGTLIAIGGNEDKGQRPKNSLHIHDSDLDFTTSGILCKILAELDSDDSLVLVITNASGIPHQVGRKYLKAFGRLGHRNIKVLHTESPEETDDSEVIEWLMKADCLLFSGGDQFKLTSSLKNTRFAKIVNDRYINDKIVIAGTSAGSMAMPDLMIYPGAVPMNVQSKKVPLYEGLSLIHDVIIDTHFLIRGRFRRLAVAVANNPGHIGLGLEEDTGIIIRQGNKIEAIGSGLVTIMDARGIQQRNLSVKEEKHEIFIENLLVHILSNGDHFTLNSKSIA